MVTHDGRTEKTIGNSEATERLQMETFNPSGWLEEQREKVLLQEPKGWESLVTRATERAVVGQHLAGVGATENTQPWQRERRRNTLAFSFSPTRASHQTNSAG